MCLPQRYFTDWEIFRSEEIINQPRYIFGSRVQIHKSDWLVSSNQSFGDGVVFVQKHLVVELFIDPLAHRFFDFGEIENHAVCSQCRGLHRYHSFGVMTMQFSALTGMVKQSVAIAKVYISGNLVHCLPGSYQSCAFWAREILGTWRIFAEFLVVVIITAGNCRERGKQLAVESRKSSQISESEPGAAFCEANDSAFMRACRLEKSDFTPIWLMRQAGRYMPSYREIRAKVGFLELCKNSQLAAEVTVNAVAELGVDAAIIFADILLLLEPLGADLEFAKGEGPVIHNPVRSQADVSRLNRSRFTGELDYVMEAIKLARHSLPAHIPLIGFAGAPFTLASYLIEGGSSRSFEKTKIFMYQNPKAWHELMALLGDAVCDYLLCQAEAGAQAVQIFDSWVGCLAVNDYEEYVKPHMVRTISGIKKRVPVIHFGTSTGHLLMQMAETGATVIGCDWRVKIARVWDEIGPHLAVQGNLDPVALFGSHAEIERRAKDILQQVEGRQGHIFNLGHGVLPETPVDNVKYLVQLVHELSQKTGRG